MKQVLCFCTCAKNNKEHYLDNIKYWRDQILHNFNNVDLFAFSDGLIEQKIQDVQIISLQPVLGRPSSGNFPGWKRSFIQACKYFLNSNYKYLIHIENDVYLNFKNNIQVVNKFKKYMMQEGLYIGYCNQHHFLQSAMMILNDRKFVQQLINYYSDINHLNQPICFEISQLRKGSWNRVFESSRLQNQLYINRAKNNLAKYDFFCQWNWQNPQII